jgi:hypothetical protein
VVVTPASESPTNTPVPAASPTSGAPTPSVTPAFGDPAVVTLSTHCAASQSVVDVNWTTVVGADRYRVGKCQGAGCTPSGTYVLADGPPYQDTVINSGEDYGYRVRARDEVSGTFGSWSETASITSATCP